jgi:hypothetical protein
MQTEPPPCVDRLNSGARAHRRRRNIVVAAGSALAGVVVVAGGYGTDPECESPADDDAPREDKQFQQLRRPHPDNSSMRTRTAVALVAALLAASCGVDGSSAAAEPQQATTTSTTVPSIPLDDGPPLEPGTYRVSSEGRTGSDPLLWSIVDYTITIPKGWKGHTGHYLSKYEDVDETRGLVIYPVLVDEIYADACEGERGRTVAVGPEVNDLVDALLAQPGTVATEPVQTTIGGRPTTRVDLEVPKGADLSSCFLADYGPPGLQIWFSDPGGKYHVLMPGYTSGVYVVDVDGERQVFLTQHGPAASHEDLRELQSMLDSIRID